jgi:hypothetical protein
MFALHVWAVVLVVEKRVKLMPVPCNALDALEILATNVMFAYLSAQPYVWILMFGPEDVAVGLVQVSSSSCYAGDCSHVAPREILLAVHLATPLEGQRSPQTDSPRAVVEAAVPNVTERFVTWQELVV